MREESFDSGVLPAEVSSFIGRERELREVERLLVANRLLTLVGPGGCGKTRLALRAARAAAQAFDDAVCWVDLAPLSDYGLLVQTVASALKVHEAPGFTLIERVIAHLKSRKALLVLDNCEHLLAACSALALELLQACPNLVLLATSRESLGISGEINWAVPPLAVPEPDDSPAVDKLLRYEAVKLFIERAKAARPGFEPAHEDAVALAHVCRMLDGMPLAIELAAVRVQVLSVAEIASRLTNALKLLTSASRTARARHRTLKATIDWSHELLCVRERQLLRRLSVFFGGFTLAAAEAVVANEDIDSADVLDLLAQLIAKSMVFMHDDDGETRYRLLETVRQYACQQLRTAREEDEFRRRHAEFFLAFSEQSEAAMSGPGQWLALAGLDQEHANLRASLTWFMESVEVEQGLRLAGALLQFWWFRGYCSEGQRWLGDLLALPGAAACQAARAKALHALGVLIHRSSGDVEVDHPVVCSHLQESIALYRQLADAAGLAAVLRDLGRFVGEQGNWQLALAYLKESFGLARRLGDACGLARTRATLGLLAVLQGEHGLARTHLEQALQVLGKLGGKNDVATCLLYLGCLACDQGDFSTARARYAEMM